MAKWGNIIVTILNEWKTILLTIFVAIGMVRITFLGSQYHGGTDDEKLSAKKSIRNSVIGFIAIPFALWLANYIYNKAKGVA